MYIFTDGITEIKNSKGDMLGSEGFKNYIKKSSENIISIKTKNKDSHKKFMLISKTANYLII